jgi:hypothetical protein
MDWNRQTRIWSGRILLPCIIGLLLLSNLSARTLYSPQLAVGSQGGLTARLEVTIMNVSDVTQRVSMNFYSSGGTHFELDSLEMGVSIHTSNLGVDLLSNQTRTWELSSTGELTTGWIRFEVPNDEAEEVVIQTTFLNLDSSGNVVAAVGIPIREAFNDFFMAVQANDVQDVGVAVANPGDVEANVTLTLLDRFGFEVGDPVNLTVGSREQIARFVTTGPDAFFVSFAPLVSARLLISSDQPISVLGLRADVSGAFLISSIPVTVVPSQ